MENSEEQVEPILIEPTPSFWDDPFGWLMSKVNLIADNHKEQLEAVVEHQATDRVIKNNPELFESYCEAKGISKDQALQLVQDGGFDMLSEIDNASEISMVYSTPSVTTNRGKETDLRM